MIYNKMIKYILNKIKVLIMNKNRQKKTFNLN